MVFLLSFCLLIIMRLFLLYSLMFILIFIALSRLLFLLVLCIIQHNSNNIIISNHLNFLIIFHYFSQIK
jgi:hypothetical protein